MHNKPLGCGASEVYASCPDSEEEEELFRLLAIDAQLNATH